MYRKISACFVLMIGLFLPLIVFAAEIRPEYNPICWQKDDCEEIRAQYYGQAQAAGGWLEKEGECNQSDWGKCLANANTKTSISFGGNTSFNNVGEYIKTIYNYALTVIGILAVVMIIVSGVQWISSAGNSEVIGKARKRIFGAVIGMFIAYMSYIILHSINPATVNLRLPQVYMVRPAVLSSKWCRDVKAGQLFAFAAGDKEQNKKIEATGKEAFNLSYPFDNPTAKTFWCGQRYFVEATAADVSCLGDRCEAGTACSDVDSEGMNNPYQCRIASVAGEIKVLYDEFSITRDIESKYDFEEVLSKTQFYLACDNGSAEGKSYEIDLEEDISPVDNGRQSYAINLDKEDLEKAKEECGVEKIRGGFIVFVFDLNMWGSEETHIFGKNGVDIFGSRGSDQNYSGNTVSRHPAWFDQNLFIPLSELQIGARIDINTDNIKRVWNSKAGGMTGETELYKESFLSGYPPPFETIYTW